MNVDGLETNWENVWLRNASNLQETDIPVAVKATYGEAISTGFDQSAVKKVPKNAVAFLAGDKRDHNYSSPVGEQKMSLK